MDADNSAEASVICANLVPSGMALWADAWSRGEVVEKAPFQRAQPGAPLVSEHLFFPSLSRPGYQMLCYAGSGVMLLFLRHPIVAVLLGCDTKGLVPCF